MISYSLKLDEPIARALDTYCRTNGRARNRIINNAIAMYLDFARCINLRQHANWMERETILDNYTQRWLRYILAGSEHQQLLWSMLEDD